MSDSVSPAFATALVAVQGSIEGAKKGKSNPAFRSKYADLGACWDACRDALQANNIAVLQFPQHSITGHVGIRTVLIYGPTGESFSGVYNVPLKDPTNPQAMGSAITYGRRYALCSVIGICPEDDDGNAATKPTAPVTATKTLATNPAESMDVWNGAFEKLTTRDEKKQFYSRLKNSPSAPDSLKTELLTKWAEVIKGMK